jgi:hypothetical protein
MPIFYDGDPVRVKPCERVKPSLHGQEGIVSRYHCMSEVYTVELNNGIVGAFKPNELEPIA